MGRIYFVWLDAICLLFGSFLLLRLLLRLCLAFSDWWRLQVEFIKSVVSWHSPRMPCSHTYTPSTVFGRFRPVQMVPNLSTSDDIKQNDNDKKGKERPPNGMERMAVQHMICGVFSMPKSFPTPVPNVLSLYINFPKSCSVRERTAEWNVHKYHCEFAPQLTALAESACSARRLPDFHLNEMLSFAAR